MSQIFKVSLLDNDKSVKKIYAFVGLRFEYNPDITDDLSNFFKQNPRHEIFSLIFTDYERKVISEENIEVIFVKASQLVYP